MLFTSTYTHIHSDVVDGSYALACKANISNKVNVYTQILNIRYTTIRQLTIRIPQNNNLRHHNAKYKYNCKLFKKEDIVSRLPGW
jgi:hypothetical protein